MSRTEQMYLAIRLKIDRVEFWWGDHPRLRRAILCGAGAAIIALAIPASRYGAFLSHERIVTSIRGTTITLETCTYRGLVANFDRLPNEGAKPGLSTCANEPK